MFCFQNENQSLKLKYRTVARYLNFAKYEGLISFSDIYKGTKIPVPTNSVQGTLRTMNCLAFAKNRI